MAYIRPNISIAGSEQVQYPSDSVTVIIDSDIPSVDTTTVGRSTITTSSDYAILITDYYIGVNAVKPTKMTLPLNPVDGVEITIKAQIGSLIDDRKITLATQQTNTINGASTYVISIPYESVTVISNGGNWWII